MRAIVRTVALLCVIGLLAACAGPSPIPLPSPTASPAASASTAPRPSATAPVAGTPSASSVPPASSPVPSPAEIVSPERLAQAQAFAGLFLEGDYAAVVDAFDATMKSLLPADKVQEVREALEPQLGAFRQTLGTLAEKYEEAGQVYDVVYVTCEFAQATIDLKIVYNQDGQVAGFFVQPTQTPTPEAYAPPGYVDESAFFEQEVTVGGGEWALPGTLSLPYGAGPFAALVLVHGSGPNDRDETLGANKPFRDLAWGLASRGVAVLRYEKRSRQHAAKFTADVLATLTLKEETEEDALLAVDLLRQTPGIDPSRIFVLGHSLGGYALPRIGAADPGIAGLVVLAGPTRPLEDLMLEQVVYILGLDGTTTADEQAYLNTLAAQVARAKQPRLSKNTPLSELPFGTPAAYWLDVRGYNPAEVAKGLNMPMLILQGGRDYQVTVADFEGWQSVLASRSNVQFKLYPDLNHLFMAGEGKSTPAEYEVAGHVAEPAIADIAGWILGLP